MPLLLAIMCAHRIVWGVVIVAGAVSTGLALLRNQEQNAATTADTADSTQHPPQS
ncbi:MAG TPA: hypothetical protein VN495_02465 [Candidatus Paceibacterota bacterium]|nr:hypothetical protein [Candidatus Paceibacterota bacterium]